MDSRGGGTIPSYYLQFLNGTVPWNQTFESAKREADHISRRNGGCYVFVMRDGCNVYVTREMERSEDV